MGNIDSDTAYYAAPFGTGDNTNEVMIVFNTESSGITARTSAVLPAIQFSINSNISSESTLGMANNKAQRKLEKLPKDAYKKGMEITTGDDLPVLNTR